MWSRWRNQNTKGLVRELQNVLGLQHTRPSSGLYPHDISNFSARSRYAEKCLTLLEEGDVAGIGRHDKVHTREEFERFHGPPEKSAQHIGLLIRTSQKLRWHEYVIKVIGFAPFCLEPFYVSQTL